MDAQPPISNFQLLTSDLLSLTIAFVYVAAIIAIAEILRRGFHLPVEFTRKFVHVGVGMSALAVTVVFRTWYIAIIGPLVFILVNYLSLKLNIFHGIEIGATRKWGTVFFPLAFVILVPILWTQPGILGASLMPLTWGDAAAAMLGSRFGMRKIEIFGRSFSVEGSLAMFVFSLIATWLALVLYGKTAGASLALAFVVALVATIVEAMSLWGIDNLAVPLASALVLVVLGG